MNGNKLHFNLASIKPKITDKGGSVTPITAAEVPGLVNISFGVLKLNPKGFRAPVWHPNAEKIGYCLQGNALVSIRSPGASDVFTVKEGDVFFVPQGYVHTISNLDNTETTLHFALNNTNPQEMSFAKAVYSLSDNVFKSTFNTPDAFYDGLKKSKKTDALGSLATGDKSNFVSSRFKFNIKDSSKSYQTKGGYLQLATKTNLPVLNGLGILGFGLKPGGIVEPHWHTNAGELVYIVKGQTRITVLDPEGNVNVMDVKAGEGAFAPASHFHNIENVGQEDVDVVAYFSHAEPDYIGIGEVLGSYSNDMLGSVFNVAPNYFDTLNKPQGPLVIVPT